MNSIPFLSMSVMLTGAIAVAQEPVMVDPEDFTRTPCEFRHDGCEEEEAPDYTRVSAEYEVLESQELSVRLESGVSFEVSVSLVETTTGNRSVLAKYEALQGQFLGEATRAAVFVELADVANTFGVDRAFVAACRESDEVCFWSKYGRADDGEWSPQ